jgi:hypothetical protein
MDRTQPQGEHWDRDQMERDTEGTPVGKPQGDVWNRHQMDIDDTGTETEAALERPEVDEDTPVGGLSGHGQPSGESHWERVEHEPAD